MSKQVLGSPIPDKVAKQIKVRGEALSSNNKTLDEMEAINSNTGFAIFRSSVNKVTYNDARDIFNASKNNCIINTNVKRGSPIKAQNYELLGGTLNPDSKTPRSGILNSKDSDDYHGAAALQRDTEAYLNYDSMGFRPMPGLTGISVATKGAYGQLRTATVNFTLNSQEQLEDAELLFFRPGYSALLEWGHTVYIDNDGNRVKTAGEKISEDLWFKSSDKADDIVLQIDKLKKKTDYNYDGLFGFITNFSYSFNKDGTYKCTVKLTSKGSIVESLKTGVQITTFVCNPGPDGEKGRDDTEDISAMHFLLRNLQIFGNDIWTHNADNAKDGYDYPLEMALRGEIKKRALAGLKKPYALGVKIYDYLTGAQSITDKQQRKLYKGLYNHDCSSTPLEFFVVKSEAVNDDSPNTIGGNLLRWASIMFNKFLTPGENLTYISFRTLLSIINSIEMPKNASNGEAVVLFSEQLGEKFKTYKSHYSIAPTKAIKLGTPTLNPDNVVKGKGFNVSLNVAAIKKGVPIDDCLSVLIETDSILQAYEETMVDGEKSILTFIDLICKIINDAFGGINHFTYMFDQNLKMFTIVDRGFPSGGLKVGIPIIAESGLNSTVLELGVESKISSNTSSQVSIAAQGSVGSGYNSNVEAMMQWNLGAVDRHFPYKANAKAEKACKIDIEESQKSDEDPKLNYTELLRKGYDQLSEGVTNTYIWPIIAEQGAKNIKEQLRLDIDKEFSFDPLPVPIELSLKLQGIAGFKIGLTFRINNTILPDRYKRFAYIITGISHDVGADNKWVTNVKALMYSTGM